MNGTQNLETTDVPTADVLQRILTRTLHPVLKIRQQSLSIRSFPNELEFSTCSDDDSLVIYLFQLTQAYQMIRKQHKDFNAHRTKFDFASHEHEGRTMVTIYCVHRNFLRQDTFPKISSDPTVNPLTDPNGKKRSISKVLSNLWHSLLGFIPYLPVSASAKDADKVNPYKRANFKPKPLPPLAASSDLAESAIHRTAALASSSSSSSSSVSLDSKQQHQSSHESDNDSITEPPASKRYKSIHHNKELSIPNGNESKMEHLAEKCLTACGASEDDRTTFLPIISEAYRLQGDLTPQTVKCVFGRPRQDSYELTVYGYRTITMEELLMFEALVDRRLKAVRSSYVYTPLISVDFKNKTWVLSVHLGQPLDVVKTLNLSDKLKLKRSIAPPPATAVAASAAATPYMNGHHHHPPIPVPNPPPVSTASIVLMVPPSQPPSTAIAASAVAAAASNYSQLRELSNNVYPSPLPYIPSLIPAPAPSSSSSSSSSTTSVYQRRTMPGLFDS